jgi:hypothetical protein
MRRKRTQKRRLSVQPLENRRLFAADVGTSDAPVGPDVPALVGAVPTAQVALYCTGHCVSAGQGPVSGVVVSPEVELRTEVTETNTTPKSTKIERPVFGPHIISF